jgi:serine/threonine protein kinase
MSTNSISPFTPSLTAAAIPNTPYAQETELSERTTVVAKRCLKNPDAKTSDDEGAASIKGRDFEGRTQKIHFEAPLKVQLFIEKLLDNLIRGELSPVKALENDENKDGMLNQIFINNMEKLMNLTLLAPGDSLTLSRADLLLAFHIILEHSLIIIAKGNNTFSVMRKRHKENQIRQEQEKVRIVGSGAYKKWEHKRMLLSPSGEEEPYLLGLFSKDLSPSIREESWQKAKTIEKAIQHSSSVLPTIFEEGGNKRKMLQQFCEYGDLNHFEADPDTRFANIHGLVLAAFEFHKTGRFHGDIKPGNALRNGTKVYITDIDNSKEFPKEGLFEHITVFTPPFTAPEVLKNNDAIRNKKEPPGFCPIRADIYSLAISALVIHNNIEETKSELDLPKHCTKKWKEAIEELAAKLELDRIDEVYANSKARYTTAKKMLVIFNSFQEFKTHLKENPTDLKKGIAYFHGDLLKVGFVPNELTPDKSDTEHYQELSRIESFLMESRLSLTTQVFSGLKKYFEEISALRKNRLVEYQDLILETFAETILTLEFNDICSEEKFQGITPKLFSTVCSQTGLEKLCLQDAMELEKTRQEERKFLRGRDLRDRLLLEWIFDTIIMLQNPECRPDTRETLERFEQMETVVLDSITNGG